MLSTQARAILVFCVLTFCIVTFLFFPNYAPALASSSDESDEQSRPECRNNAPVANWFAVYDQIRRDAEMTMGDKMQARSLSANKPSKKNAELASRMLNKYTIALAAMKELTPVPETNDLHDGYTEYFGQARELFSDFIVEQEKIPFSNQKLVSAKKKLEELDSKNKLLDKQLRQKFKIPKHKHS